MVEEIRVSLNGNSGLLARKGWNKAEKMKQLLYNNLIIYGASLDFNGQNYTLDAGCRITYKPK